MPIQYADATLVCCNAKLSGVGNPQSGVTPMTENNSFWDIEIGENSVRKLDTPEGVEEIAVLLKEGTITWDTKIRYTLDLGAGADAWPWETLGESDLPKRKPIRLLYDPVTDNADIGSAWGAGLSFIPIIAVWVVCLPMFQAKGGGGNVVSPGAVPDSLLRLLFQPAIVIPAVSTFVLLFGGGVIGFLVGTAKGKKSIIYVEPPPGVKIEQSVLRRILNALADATER